LLIYLWIQYVKYYNTSNNAGVFLTGIWPFWEASSTEKIKIFSAFLGHILFQFHSPIVLFSVFFASIYSFFYFEENYRFVAIAQIVIVIGFFSFFLLFYKVFDVHDYYLCNWVIIIPATIISFFLILKSRKASIFKTKWVNILLVFIFIHSMYYGAALTRAKCFSNDFFSNEYITFNQVSRLYYNWSHFNYKSTIKSCETIEPYLRSKGIMPSDRIISIPDQSINISLVLMNQFGFTDYGYILLQGKERIEYFKNKGAKYLIINDTSILNNRNYLNLFTKIKIGSYKNINIYDLK